MIRNSREISLRTYRRDRRFTQAEMGEKLDISRSYVAGIESGRMEITEEIARKIGRRTKQSVGDIISEWERMFGRRAGISREAKARKRAKGSKS